MRRYLDTSLLVPLYVLESRTADAQHWIAGLEGQTLAVSPWCLAEFSSALALKSRRGELTQEDLLIAENEFRQFVAGRATVLDVASKDFYRASELCLPGLGLRSGDALHLAVAERCGLTVCTLDRGMSTAALALGLPCETF